MSSLHVSPPCFRLRLLGGIGLLPTVLICLLAGCSLPGTKPALAKQAYLLQGDGTHGVPAAGKAKPCLSLRVSTPASAPGFGTTRMAYVVESPRLDYFAYHEWADTPAKMTAAIIGGRLDASGLFGAVLTGSADVRTDLRLDSELIRLRQMIDGASSAVELVIKVGLIDVSSRSLLAAKTFSYTEAAAGANPPAGVAAANRAADRFLTDLINFVADSIAAIDCPQGSIGPSGE